MVLMPAKVSGGTFLPNWPAIAAALTPMTPSRIGALGAILGPALVVVMGRAAVAAVVGTRTGTRPTDAPEAGAGPVTGAPVVGSDVGTSTCGSAPELSGAAVARPPPPRAGPVAEWAPLFNAVD